MLVRGRDCLTVGFWNIEKKNIVPDDGTMAFETKKSRDWAVVMREVKAWYTTKPFDVLILAEVTNSRGKGDEFANVLAQQLSIIGFPKRNIQGVFRWSETASGSVSVCNFAVFWDEGIPELTGLGEKISFFWEPDWVRPIVILPASTLVIAGIHAKSARRDLAAQEIVEACAYLERYRNRAVLIGDMNIPFDEFSPTTTRELSGIEWSRVPPGLTATHVSHSERYRPAVLDYIWRNGGASQCKAKPPDPTYDMWDVVDHAPIQYRISWKSEASPG